MVLKSGVHQLRLVVEIPLFIYKVLAPSQVVQDFWTINSMRSVTWINFGIETDIDDWWLKEVSEELFTGN